MEKRLVCSISAPGLVAVTALALWMVYFSMTPPRTGFDPFFTSTTMVLAILASSTGIISLETAWSVALEKMRQRMIRNILFARWREEALLSYLVPGRTARTHSVGRPVLVLVEFVHVRIETTPFRAHTEDLPANDPPIQEKRKTSLVEHLPLNWQVGLSMAAEKAKNPFEWPNWLHALVVILVVLFVLAMLTFMAMAFVWVMKGAGWLALQLLKSFFEAEQPLDYLVFAACLATLIGCRRWQKRTLPAAVLSALLR
jgi:hypothetical protein